MSVAAYTYKADIYCVDCIIEVMLLGGEASPAARDMPVEEALDQIAEANATDRYNESTFDSDDFPKVVFSDQLSGEHCGGCGGGIVG